MDPFILEFDGACEPRNPGGYMTWAYIIRSPISLPVQNCGIINPHASNTNNLAEWYALGYGIRRLFELRGMPHPFHLMIHGDSQLVVNQLTGRWKCNKRHLEVCRCRCITLLEKAKEVGCEKWCAEWIPREENKQADVLGRAVYFQKTGKPMPERPKRGAA